MSASKRAAEARRTPLADFAGWKHTIDCGTPACARDRAYDVRGFAGTYPGCTVGDFLRRLRCGVCGKVPIAVSLRPFAGTRVEPVPLIGPGAY